MTKAEREAAKFVEYYLTLNAEQRAAYRENILEIEDDELRELVYFDIKKIEQGEKSNLLA